MSTEKNKIIQWIQETLGNKNCDVEFEKTSAKGEGYIGNLYFVKVKLDKQTQNGNFLNLIVKVGKTDKALRDKTAMIRVLCEREIYFYDKVVPAFINFQQSQNIKDLFDVFPKCYKTFLDDNNEVIIMDNLKAQGYGLYPRARPLNIAHTRLLLKNYAKLHALSLAMQDQNKEIFENLTRNYCSNVQEVWHFFKPILENNSVKLLKELKDMGREDLSSEYERCFMQKGVYSHLVELINDIPKEKVILHADCHNGNFLFKYEGTDRSTPTNVALIDFQTSLLHSPLLDIGYLLYAGISKDEFAHFNDLMKFYYNEISSFLVQLGSNPKTVFPESLFWDHWKKYSTYGFLGSSTLLELLFIVKGSEPAMEGNADKEFHEAFAEITLTSKEEYSERLLTIVDHYFSFQNI